MEGHKLMNKLLGDPRLEQVRTALREEDALMRRGIFTEPDIGRDYFTGYAHKTLYD